MEVELLERVTDDEIAQIIELMHQLSPEKAHDSVRVNLEEMLYGDPSSSIYVVRDDGTGKIIGMTTLNYNTRLGGKKCLIEDVVVHKEHRRRGVGHALMERAIASARQWKACVVDLTSTPKRGEAHSLYEDLGFERRDTNVYRLRL